MHGAQGQNELVSLNGNLGMSDKASAVLMGYQERSEAPKVFVSRSFPREAVSQWVSVCQSQGGTGDLHLQYPIIEKVPRGCHLFGGSIYYFMAPWLLTGPHI